MTTSTKNILRVSVMLGCDPEFFITRKGKVIGSEKVIDPDKGLQVTHRAARFGGTKKSKFICDGVQIEMNPLPETCRALLGSEIAGCFKTLKATLDKDPSLKVCFDISTKITKTELRTLSPKARILGCSPSLSTSKEPVEGIPNGADYPYRSAGGHIHLGDKDGLLKNAFSDPERLINLLDVIVGNTCVLLDRDEANKERRKVYGRAGEYRLPKYGLEYRTLSNFWLQAYPLMSFVMSTARLAVSIAQASTKENDIAAELLALVDMKEIHAAINENDFDKAYANFNKVKSFLISTCSAYYTDHPFTPERTLQFEYVANMGFRKFFKTTPMVHWTEYKEWAGWEYFLITKVAPIINK